MTSNFYTIEREGKGIYKEKMSKFLSFALPVSTAEEAKIKIKDFQNEYHDARHVCWAYMLGKDRKEWQLNDNGEPSGTAGKPILGQINSFGLTDVLVVVVRYFGGIKLGTPGLIAAYREAARLALEDGGKIEKHSMAQYIIHFPYMAASGVMKILKSSEAVIVDQVFDNTCSITFKIREDHSEKITGQLGSLSGISFS